MIIRAERETDIDAIFDIARKAFENHPDSQGADKGEIPGGVVARHPDFFIKNRE